MYSFLFYAYEFLSVMLPFVVLVFVIQKRSGKKTSWQHVACLFAFAFYIAGVFYFTGTGTLYDLLRRGFGLRPGQLNLVPFSNTIDITGYLLNVLLFAPLGFFLPLLWPKLNKPVYPLVYGLLFSLLVEASQLLTSRGVDVDDLLMNTAGALLGFLVFRLFARITKFALKNPNQSKAEPLLYICAMFLGRFLLLNDIGLAGLIYGF